MEILAYAKINLSLEILGSREDGYHQVVTILHTVNITDHLIFEPSDRLTLSSSIPSVPVEQNLVMKAARLLQQETGCDLGAGITLEKSIPIAAGLGGGSSDAAATLKALNALWNLGMPKERLREMAARLGSDVPFFIDGGCALAEGRGEALTALPPMTGWWAVIVVPAYQVADKTALLYRLLMESEYSDGSATRRLAEHIRAGTVSMDMLTSGQNTFEAVAPVVFPGLEEHRTALLQAGAYFMRLTGSGPAWYTLVESRKEGMAILKELKAMRWQGFLARLLGRRTS